MANETDDLENAAARLEAALERIARRAAAPKPEAGSLSDPNGEITERLDSLIDRLRDALASKPG